MVDQAKSLNPQQINEVLRRYGHSGQPLPDLCYSTVKDFCDSADHLPFLSAIQSDLKDVQRPAALKTILALVRPGSSLLEIGAGEPHVANTLQQLGYKVIVVDPYDGSGRGPTEYEYYSSKYPNIEILREVFSPTLKGVKPNTIDCIYSISVLEHIHQPALTDVFQGIQQFLRKGGHSLHLIDHVTDGTDAKFHRTHLEEIVIAQSRLQKDQSDPLRGLDSLLTRLHADIETYYLSADGHNRWRGATPYESFPFRKIVSIQSLGRKV